MRLSNMWPMLLMEGFTLQRGFIWHGLTDRGTVPTMFTFDPPRQMYNTAWLFRLHFFVAGSFLFTLLYIVVEKHWKTRVRSNIIIIIKYTRKQPAANRPYCLAWHSSNAAFNSKTYLLDLSHFVTIFTCKMSVNRFSLPVCVSLLVILFSFFGFLQRAERRGEAQQVHTGYANIMVMTSKWLCNTLNYSKFHQSFIKAQSIKNHKASHADTFICPPKVQRLQSNSCICIILDCGGMWRVPINDRP